jgi:hypothetical protein
MQADQVLVMSLGLRFEWSVSSWPVFVLVVSAEAVGEMNGREEGGSSKLVGIGAEGEPLRSDSGEVWYRDRRWLFMDCLIQNRTLVLG